MSRNKNSSEKKKLSFSSLMDNNKVVFIFSLIISFISWCGVSIYQTPVIEKVFSDIAVRIDDSLPKNSGLEIFGQKEFTADVTVKGLSYIVNSPDFKEKNITVNASCSAVAAAGTYDLPVTASVFGTSSKVEIVSVSVQSVKVSFDERITKTFGLVADVTEGADYSLAEGFVRENPLLSVNAVQISGPAREMLKITALKAHAQLNGELRATQTLEAEIIAESASGTIDLSRFTFAQKEPVYITVPVKKTEKFMTAVNFSGIPQAYKEKGISYSVDPSEINISLISDDSGSPSFVRDDKLFVGTIDFRELDNKVNKITVISDNPAIETDSFSVTVDMSGMSKKKLDVPIDVSSLQLPKNVSVLSSSIKGVSLIGPASSLAKVDQKAVYAVPELKNISLTYGRHTVPVKIIFRTINDSWAFGVYETEISVK